MSVVTTSEDEETISSLTGRWEALANWFPCAVLHERADGGVVAEARGERQRRRPRSRVHLAMRLDERVDHRRVAKLGGA